MSTCTMRGKLQRAALLDAIVFLSFICATAGVFLPSTKASNLLFLQLREPRPQGAAAVPGAKPVKNLLMHLAALNQKLTEGDDSAADQLEAPSGAPEGSDLSEASLGTTASSRGPSAGPGRSISAGAHRHGGSSASIAMLGLSATVIPRPQAGTPNADTVWFGLYGKTFYGVDLKAQEYTIDSVLTMTWMDPRTISMVPIGLEDFTLSDAESIGNVWTPGVEITNGAGQRFDRISSSVTIAKDGKVTQVERVLAVIKNRFILNDFPFDKQTLRLNVASMQYMLNEVALTPIGGTTFSGLHKGFFDGEDYIESDFSVKAYEDINGPLKKSRGSMEIGVTRSLSRFQRNFLLPAFLYLAISCAVFWLPFSPTFVTPRVALSIFILLIFSNLAANADAELPGSAPYNWIDLICFTIQLHMFTVVCLNIFTEIAYHSMKCTATAVHISNELKIIAPVVGTMSMAAILAASTNPEGPLGLQTMTMLMPVMFFLFLISYMACCGSTLSAEIAKIKHAEAQKAQEYYPPPHGVHGHGLGGLGPLASSESLAPAPRH